MNSETLNDPSFVVVSGENTIDIASTTQMTATENDIIHSLTSQLEEMTDIVRSSLESQASSYSSAAASVSGGKDSSSRIDESARYQIDRIVRAESREHQQASMNSICTNLQKENNSLNSRISEKDVQLKDCHRRISELELEVAKRESELDIARNQIDAFEDFDRAENDNDKLQKMRQVFLRMKEVNDEKLTMKQNFESLLQEHKTIEENNVGEKQSHIEELETEIKKLKADLEAKETEIKNKYQVEATESISLYEDEIKKHKESMKELRKENTLLKEKLEDSDLAELEDSHKHEIERLKKNNEKKLRKLNTTIKELEADLEEEREKAKDAERSQQSTEKQLKNFRDKFRKEKDEHAATRAQLEELESSEGCMTAGMLKESQLKVAQLEKANEELKRNHAEELRALRSRANDGASSSPVNETKSREMAARYQTEIGELNEEIKNLKNQIQEAEQKASELVEEISDKEGEIASLKHQLKEAGKSSHKDEEMQKVCDENNVMKSKLKEMERTVNTLNEKKKQLLNDNRNLKSEKACLEIKVATFEKTAGDTKIALEESETLKMELRRKENECVGIKKKSEAEITTLKEKVTQLERQVDASAKLKAASNDLEDQLQEVVMRLSNVYDFASAAVLPSAQSQEHFFENPKEAITSVEKIVEKMTTEWCQQEKYICLLKKELKLKENRQRDIEMLSQEANHKFMQNVREREIAISDIQKTADERCKALYDIIYLLQDRLEAITLPNVQGSNLPFPNHDNRNHAFD